jgi:hypothetical protein
MAVLFVKNQAGWNHAFHSWSGTLGQWQAKKTVEVQVRAMQKAPVKTGATKGSIRFSLGYSGGELQSSVGIGTRQGLWVHQGTRRHVIRPRNPSSHLSFFWPKVGHVVYPKQVNHPGTKANPFLWNALQKVFGQI